MAKLRKLWLLRKDGHRQRYLTSRANVKKRGYTYDKRKRSWGARPARKPVRKPPTAPPVGELVRQTIAINYVNRNTYFSIVLQAWSRSEQHLRNLEAQHKEEVTRELERVLGWRRSEWWFVHQYGIGYQRVPYSKFLDGRKEVRNERRGG